MGGFSRFLPATGASRTAAAVVDDPGDAASAKVRRLGWALSAIVAFCLLVTLGTLVATQRESIAIATEREQRQVGNSLATSISDVRTNLTSVTFWDEAAARTGVRFDKPWVDENIGIWLARYYAIDDCFVLTADGAPQVAYRTGRPVAPGAFDRYRPYALPLLGPLRSQLSTYRPGAAGHAALTDAAGASPPRLDAMRLVMIGGQPRVLIVAPILPDFGHIDGPLPHPAILVASLRLDGHLLQTIGRDLMLDGLRVASATEPLAADSNRLPLTIEGRHAALELRWQLHSRRFDLARRSLPVVATLLVMMVLASLLGTRFVRESAQQLYSLRSEARRDELTGLPNRRHLTGMVELLIRAGQPFGLLFVDLDRFKHVNDLWGHAAGDEVIREAAARLSAIVGTEQVARFGGDEFVLVVGGEAEEAETIGIAVLAALREPFTLGANVMVLAGSVGVALMPRDGPSAEDLMRKADLALYRAKTLGKDRVVLFDERMDGALRERQALERDLRRAVATKALEVAYQPQFGRGERGLVGVEALARWRRANGEIVEPGIFIPLAEDLGLIGAIDAAILELACHQAAAWRGVSLAVNVSPCQLHSTGYSERVLAALSRSGLEPGRLRLEITETALFGHMGQVAQTVATLRAAGVHFAIDDFGTGFSSLDRLRMLKLDGMKIDRSFVADLECNPDAPPLIGSMVALGHALGLTVTAEGVETEAQHALLQLAGCDEYQGNLLGKPMPAAAIAALLDRQPRPAARRA